ARLIAWLLHINGNKVALACRDGFYLGARQVEAHDSTHWEDAQRLLINRAVEVAVFENDSRMILSEGLAYDKCSVGVVTDVSGFEALTEFYIDDLDKLSNVVRTQVDVILPHGTAVLNAADARVVAMAGLCDGEIIFYGLDPQLDAIGRHRADGKRVVFVQNRQIVLAQGMEQVALVSMAAMKPTKTEKPDMLMAAVAAAWAAGVAPELIEAGLRAYESDPKKKH
ncbi:MAG: cyanophycin synthetase, partial [Rhodoferax sp.]|nr:cyanophycin synthetase [Rhodoferax sp.]